MYETRRLAMAADADARPSAGGAGVASAGGRNAVGDERGERTGGRGNVGRGGPARPAGAAGHGGADATAPHPALSSRVAVGACAEPPGARPAAADPSGPRTLARDSRAA